MIRTIVTQNPHVRDRVTTHGVVWALTSTEDANWFPATRLSHLIDGEIFGLRPGGHHFTDALLHALATVLLFAFLHAATGGLWPSAFVAMLFALHPLHVESVARIAERKDVLSAVFWFGALWSYLQICIAYQSFVGYVLLLFRINRKGHPPVAGAPQNGRKPLGITPQM
jgi:hypothetical protein